MKAIEIMNKLMRAENWDDYYPSRHQCNEAIKELEGLETKDRLAELEKVILDYYLAKGYQIGADGLGFKVRITTLYQWKLMHVILLYPTKLVFQVITETPKEMFDKAFEHFSIKEQELNKELKESNSELLKIEFCKAI